MAAWFEDQFPWHGSFSGFVNDCLEELQSQWGDSPTPNSVIPSVVKSAMERTSA